MKKVCGMLVLGVVVASVFGAVLLAEDAAEGALRGTFVRLVERAVGEREYLGIVVKPFEGDDHVTVLVSRRQEELIVAARKLREGQKVEIEYVTEAGHNWVKGFETEWRPEAGKIVKVRLREGERREGERERPEARRPWVRLEQMEGQLREAIAAHFERMRREFRVLLVRVEQLEKEVRGLRAENERLKRALRESGRLTRERREEGPERREREERREGEERREREERREVRIRIRKEVGVSLPAGMRGFRGVLVGTVSRKLDRGFLLKVEKLGEVWEQNKADNPRAAVGKELRIVIRSEGEGGERFLRTLRGLERGDRVIVEAFHFEGNHLTVVEQLKKSD